VCSGTEERSLHLHTGTRKSEFRDNERSTLTGGREPSRAVRALTAVVINRRRVAQADAQHAHLWLKNLKITRNSAEDVPYCHHFADIQIKLENSPSNDIFSLHFNEFKE
jgi:hypothetical protein